MAGVDMIVVPGIKSLNVQDMQAVVEDGKIARYRVNMKVSFVIDYAAVGSIFTRLPSAQAARSVRHSYSPISSSRQIRGRCS